MNRTAFLERKTSETQIFLELCLDGGETTIDTGICFFNHMLEAFAVHSGFGLKIKVTGDLHVDFHHTVEDTGIVLGQALAKVLEDKKGIMRFGNSVIPMDEALCECVLDISGRPFLVFKVAFDDLKTGEFDMCLVKEFFYAVAINGGITLHLIDRYPESHCNSHHKCEALFKAFAHATKKAVQQTGGNTVLSSKGVL
jgi:imidazoleglycerol-phosphate dehydratase